MSAQNLEALLASRKTLVIGAPSTPLEQALLAALGAGGEAPRRVAARAELDAALAARAAAEAVAVVFDAALVERATIEALVAQQCRGVVWASAEPIDEALLRAARPGRLRFLGPRTAGFWRRGGLAAGALAPGGGEIALIAQSGSIAAAALDWAAGRGIGFSWAVTTGAESDADVADFLDVAALDPATRAVILQLGSLRGGRKFMSAARACARIKPVVVLQSRTRSGEARTAADPVRSAAFARAGLVECETLDGLFDALSALARVPARREARVLTLGNGAGVCALGVDAILRYGLTPAACDAASFAAVQALAPRARRLEGAVDLGPVEPRALAQACARLLADTGVDYLLLVHSPSVDAPHEPCVDALHEARLAPRLVTVWLGLQTAGPARSRSAEAGLPTFGTAGQAARALRYRWLHGRRRELLMQTPPPRPPSGCDRRTARAQLEAALARGAPRLEGAAAEAFLSCYGVAAPGGEGAAAGTRIELELRRHPELGMHLAITARAGLLRSATARGFAPLDALLARRLIEDMGLAADAAAEVEAKLRAPLLALSDVALEQPAVAALRLDCALGEGDAPCARRDAVIELDAAPPPERRRLVLAPYPGELARTLATRDGRAYRMRPVRPEDEPALIALLERMRPEDVRLRFFASIRRFSHEMAARMTQIDYDRELVLVAEPEESPGTLCALAQLVIDPYGEAGEFAILVHHEHAGHGLGRLLMDELLAQGRRRGLRRIYGDVLRENASMLALADHLGFVRSAHDDPDCRRVEIELPAAAPPPSSRLAS